jgi:nuclear cap-binding protein subunit 1
MKTLVSSILRRDDIVLRCKSTANAHYDTAQSVLDDLRSRREAVDVLSHIDALKAGIIESDGLTTEAASSILRTVTVQSLLHLGSRSFSHLLNAIERYLPVLRALAEGKSGKGDILAAAARFWALNPQMVGIVFDKLMQYQIVDPSDVVAFAFRPTEGKNADGAVAIDTESFDLLRGALDKANGRVVIARKKVTVLSKEDEENRAKVKAKEGAMEVDADGKAGPSFTLPCSIMN